MSDAVHDPDPNDAAARALLRTTPLARWLAPTSESRLERIACRDIEPRPWPAPAGLDDELVALVLSVRQRGVVEPVLLRPLEGSRFQVVLGARRMEAARRCGLTEVPAIVRDLDEAEATLLAAWSVMPRMRAGEILEVASRLTAAGVSDAEIAVLLGADPRAHPASPDPGCSLIGGGAPLRFAGAATPVQLLLSALGERGGTTLACLGGVEPELLG
ncbi:MAG TPA: ParB N-terminal domain-containing protein [Candidatus Binatia bacterium]|nr:ParB N-terminal domain-containing protein [Candidatus Binatia bacterium]